MISIEKNCGRKYIAGIFKTKKKALEHFSAISNKEVFNFVEYVDFSFPFFLYNEFSIPIKIKEDTDRKGIDKTPPRKE